MIISISGDAGSGKSTVAKMLAEKLNWPRYYMGGLRREAAKKRGMTLEEYNTLGERDESTDKEVDEYQRELGNKEDNFVIEGRTSFYFIPQSFKIYLTVDEHAAAKRIWGQLQHANERNEGNATSEEDVLAANRKRRASDITRYKRYYGIENVYDTKPFDLVIDTTNFTPEQVLGLILAKIKPFIDKNR